MSKITNTSPTSKKPLLSANWQALKRKLDAEAPPKQSTEPQTKKSKTGNDDLPKTSTRKLTAQGRPKLGKISKSNKFPKESTRNIKMESRSTDKGTSASLALWAEDNDISPEDLAKAYSIPLSSTTLPASAASDLNANSSRKREIGKYVAIDCEMVGVGGPENERSALARVSIVNYYGHCVLDVFVKPQEKVTDWRTWVSGVSSKDMLHAVDFPTAQSQVSTVLKDRILIGHAVRHDLNVLLLSHPKRDVRDTSKHLAFRKVSNGKTPGLKRLAKELLGIEIQGGEHSSVEDARACMLLYRRNKAEFEAHNAQLFPPKKEKGQGKRQGKKKKKKTTKSQNENGDSTDTRKAENREKDKPKSGKKDDMGIADSLATILEL